MSDSTAWFAGNTRYLNAAVAWVRAVLEEHVPREQPAPTAPSGIVLPPSNPPAPAPGGGSRWKSLLHGDAPRGPIMLPAATPTPTQARTSSQGAGGASATVQEAESAMQQAASAIDPPPAAVILSQRLGLSPLEHQILLLCIASELNAEVGSLCMACQRSSRLPTFGLALALFDDPAWEALAPERPLRFWRLIEIFQGSGDTVASSPLRVDERILSYSKGLDSIDDRLGPYMSSMESEAGLPPLPPSHSVIAEQITRALKAVGSGQTLPLIQLLGPDTLSKHRIAFEIARSTGLQLHRLAANILPAQIAELDLVGRLWHRESLLLPVMLYVEVAAPGGEQPHPFALLSRFLDRLDGAVFLDAADSVPGGHRTSLSFDIAKPTAAEQIAAWRAELGTPLPKNGEPKAPELLAAQFNLNLPSIHGIAQESLEEAHGRPEAIFDLVWQRCLVSSRPRLEALVQRIEPKSTWDDFVLPPADLILLRQIAEQVSARATVYEQWGFSNKLSRGLGISALFAGDSGTGKSMAAEVIANHLKLNLYRIDLSAVVSKYIGETEKNLRQLFDNAENGGAILFFDEADALFGKRSEVKDSHDRYANIEVNYLLQRMESFRGLAILATNVKSALDPAFMRRLRFVVNFHFPSVAERKLIWQRVFPAQVPQVGLDFERLARLNIAGGHIHSIALNSAFLAARANSAVTMPLLLEAARTEFRKLERPINELDFRQVAAASTPIAAGAVA